MSAITFLYRHVLGRELALPPEIIRAKKASHLPTVLSKQEALAVIGNMQGTTTLMAQLLYGGGLLLVGVGVGVYDFIINWELLRVFFRL